MKPSMKASFFFTKMHGLGNDFVVIDDLKTKTLLTPRLARQICDRHFGIGADQILWLKKPRLYSEADARMEILNADGTPAEMCGNGIRAVALYLAKKWGLKFSSTSFLQIETLAGLIKMQLHSPTQVRVNMGVPVLNGSSEKPIQVKGKSFPFYRVHVGNPHCVIFTQKLDKIPIGEWGPHIENHRRFPRGVNVEWVEVLNPHEIRVRVWERGAGATLACGSGACAAAVAALASGKIKPSSRSGSVFVHLPGGKLKIEWAQSGHPVYMVGGATHVFAGQYSIAQSQ